MLRILHLLSWRKNFYAKVRQKLFLIRFETEIVFVVGVEFYSNAKVSRFISLYAKQRQTTANYAKKYA